MKKALFILVCCFLLITIYSIAKSIFEIWQKQSVLNQASSELTYLKKQNEDLQKQLALTKDPGFKEEQIRNKLFLVKSNEQILLVPTEAPRNKIKTGEAKIEPNYILWLKVFRFNL